MPNPLPPSRQPFMGEPPPKRVLIVRPTALGDVARTVPVLATLRKALPDARIDWLVAKTFADAVRHHPMLNEVIEFDRKALSRFGYSLSATKAGWRFAQLLRQNRYDAVYDFQGLFRSGLFTRISGARRRIGFANAREAAWLGYNTRHRVGNHQHTVDRMLGLLKADGLEPVDDTRLYLGNQDADWLKNFKQEHHIGHPGYACLAPTARWGCKCWPIERYGQIARRMLEESIAGDKLILLASPDERDQVLPIFETLMGSGASGGASGGTSGGASGGTSGGISGGASGGISGGGGDLRERVVFPSTSVGQMMALLSETRVLVCNDSAPLHIAVGFDRPVVALFGPTDPATVGPYQRSASVLRPPQAQHTKAHYRRHQNDPTLISKITIDQVWTRLVETFDGR